jgi:hypothetical protein
MSPLSISLVVRLTPAGEERARLAAEHGAKVLGKHLPIRKLSVEQSGRSRTYFIGPVLEGGPDERLAWVEIGMGR